MSRKNKFFILVASISFLIWFSTQNLSKLGLSKPYYTPPVAGQQLDAYELNEFLGLWSRILQGPLRKYMRQISLSSQGQYPEAVVKWLDSQNWNIERFFYNEQRLLGVLDYVNLRMNLNSNKELSKKGGVDLKDLIHDQERRMKACPYSKAELDLVENNLYQVTEILAGRAVLTSDK